MFLGKMLYCRSASPLQVYKWESPTLILRCNPALDGPADLIQGGVKILQVASCCRNRDKFRPNGQRGSYADFAQVVEKSVVGLNENN